MLPVQATVTVSRPSLEVNGTGIVDRVYAVCETSDTKIRFWEKTTPCTSENYPPESGIYGELNKVSGDLSLNIAGSVTRTSDGFFARLTCAKKEKLVP
jgi:hypothetical protein